MIRRRIVLGVLLFVLFGLGWWVGRGGARGGDLYQDLDVFVEVLQKVEDNYVDAVEPSQLVNGAIKGMLSGLDPYSQFLDGQDYQNLQAVTHGSFGGIGVEVVVRDNYPTVIAPIEGSPAWTLGIRSGDVIVRVDGQSTAGLTIEAVATKLRGPEGSHVQVTVRREGSGEEVEYAVERREIVTKSVPYAFVAEGNVGYLRLARFSETSGAEARAALERLKAQGATRLVLDLRGNPGGLLDQAVDVAEAFVKQGTLIVYTRGRAKGQDNRFYSSEARPQLEWPMVVLVDGASASASEIVAGALQDLDRALVVGRTSFGKGSVQQLYPLQGNSVGLKLTTARYYTPSGRSIHRLSADLHAGDTLGTDEGDTPIRPDSTALDSTARVRYHTAGGRIVYGGGGIRPDVEVRADSLPPLTDRIESRGLTFRFANRLVNLHPQWKLGTPLTPEVWRDFTTFLAGEKVTATDAEIAAERPVLDRALRRELARRLGGDAAAVRVALEGDPVYERALQVLSRARTAREVFAVAAIGAPREPAGVH